MNSRFRAAFAVGALVVFAACAGNPQPGDDGYPYNVHDRYDAEFVVNSTSYTGSMTLATAKGGVVDGTLSVTAPATITGTVTGMVVGDTLNFESDYEIAENGCGGSVTGTGLIAEGGDTVSGTMDVYDACADQTMAASFDLRR
jgi:nitrous oxidase accessory protein NosD